MKVVETVAAAGFFVGLGVLAGVSIWLGEHPIVVAPALLLVWVVGAISVRDLVGDAVDELRGGEAR